MHDRGDGQPRDSFGAWDETAGAEEQGPCSGQQRGERGNGLVNGLIDDRGLRTAEDSKVEVS